MKTEYRYASSQFVYKKGDNTLTSHDLEFKLACAAPGAPDPRAFAVQADDALKVFYLPHDAPDRHIVSILFAMLRAGDFKDKNIDDFHSLVDRRNAKDPTRPQDSTGQSFTQIDDFIAYGIEVNLNPGLDVVEPPAEQTRMSRLEHYMRVEGNPITRLEALTLFGVQNITAWIDEMRKDGWVIKSNEILMIEAIRRLNEVDDVVFAPARNLPVKQISMTQWWFSK